MATLPTSAETTWNPLGTNYTVIEIPLTQEQANGLKERISQALEGQATVKTEARDDGTYRVAVDEKSYEQWGLTVKDAVIKADLLEKEAVKTVQLPERKGMDYVVGQEAIETNNQQFRTALNEEKVARSRLVDAVDQLTPEDKRHYQDFNDTVRAHPELNKDQVRKVQLQSPQASDGLKAVAVADKEVDKVHDKLEVLRKNAHKLGESVMADRLDEIKNKKPLAQPIQDRKDTAVEIIGHTNQAQQEASRQEEQHHEVFAKMAKEQPKNVSSNCLKG